MHSWRVLILPHLGVEEEKLYRQYRFDESWNGPHNRDLAGQMPEAFGCPLDPSAFESQTSFLALIDGVTVEFAVQPHDPNAPTTPQSNTEAAPSKAPFMVVEVADSNVNWMEPKDLVLAGKPSRWLAAAPPVELSYHVGESHVLLDDLTVREISADEVRTVVGWKSD
jgi:hypothetical protein